MENAKTEEEKKKNKHGGGNGDGKKELARLVSKKGGTPTCRARASEL